CDATGLSAQSAHMVNVQIDVLTEQAASD
ncbi:MAG: hypothetical protein QOH56_4359, partial [Pseudonocardiales bacterium]|nr:hypothetical protein [Pseudonocardiales bacterium]